MTPLVSHALAQRSASERFESAVSPGSKSQRCLSSCIRQVRSLEWGIAACLLTATLACAAPDSRPYAIFTSALTCEQAQQLASQVMERLGYTITSSLPASSSGEGVIHGARQGFEGQESVSVKIICGADGVRMDAEADIPPCEQANQLAQRAVERLGYTVTSSVPAVTGGRVGIVKGKRDNSQGQDSVALTVTCTAEAVYVDTRSDSPLVASTDFTAAITDFRRGFFSLFKPLADETQHQGQPH